MSLIIKPAALVAAAETSGAPGLLARAEHWQRVPLGAVVSIINGAAFSSHEFNDAGVGLPLIRIRDLDGWTGTSYSGDYSPAHLVERGDLLLGMDGDFNLRRWNGPKALLNQRVCRLSVRNPKWLDDRFLALVLPGYLRAIHAGTSSITVKHLSSRDLAEIPLPLPPRAEQTRIAQLLEGQLDAMNVAFASVDQIEKQGRALELMVLERAARGTLADTSRPFAPAPQVKAAKDSVKFNYEALPALPLEWHWVPAQEACTAVFNGSTPKADLMTAGQGEVPFFKVYNIDKRVGLDFSVRPTYVSRHTHEGQLQRSRLRPGDVLINIVGPPMGKVALVPDAFPEANMNQAIVGFRPGPQLDARYLTIALRAPFVLDRLTATSKATAGQFNISLTACRELPLPIPPLAEQKTIVTTVEAHLVAMHLLLKDLQRLRQRLHGMRHALLAHVVSGQLDTRRSADRPADLLLKEIEEARAAQAVAEPKKRSGRARRAPVLTQKEISE